MKGGLWIVLALSRLAGRYAASLAWALAAVLAALLLDMPLHAPPHGGAPSFPAAPAVQQMRSMPPAPRKEKVKLIEFAPWEQVPA
jgi:hypothetical protein